MNTRKIWHLFELCRFILPYSRGCPHCRCHHMAFVSITLAILGEFDQYAHLHALHTSNTVCQCYVHINRNFYTQLKKFMNESGEAKGG